MSYLNNTKTRYFLAGLAVGAVGVKALKSKAAKRFYTNALARGMKLKANVEAAFEKIKEDAQDICYESKQISEKNENGQS